MIVTLLMIHPRFVPEKTGESVIESMREGINFLRKREGMMGLVALAFFGDVALVSPHHFLARHGAGRLSRRLEYLHFVPVLLRRGIHSGRTARRSEPEPDGARQAIVDWSCWCSES